MDYETVKLTIDGAVATITMNRPEVLNAMTTQLGVDIRDALRVVRRNETLKVLVLTGEGKAFSRVSFALGKYYLQKKDFVKAAFYMEAGRDKSNKNKIESNDPVMLVSLAKAYYRTKKFSEALEIYFEISKQFPAVRQIQIAMQGVYSMEQKSAGDAKIL